MEVGKFLKPHGLKGELNIITDVDSDVLGVGYPLILDMDGLWMPFYVCGFRRKSIFAGLITIEGFDSKEKAAELVNKSVFMLKKDVTEFLQCDEDELMRDTDLVGMMLHDYESDKVIGEITGVDDSTENWLLTVTDSNGDDIFIPFHEDLVRGEEEDEEGNGILYMEIPPGILDLNKKSEKQS